MIETVTSPYSSPLRWDYVECNGVISPGVIPRGGITGFIRKFSFDPKNAYGMMGPSLTFAFRPAAEGSIRFWTWTAAQYDAMGNFLSVLEYDPTKTKVRSIDIFHPALACLGIRRVVTTEIHPPKHQGGKKYEWEISLIEYRPPPKIPVVQTPVNIPKKKTFEEGAFEKQLDDLNARGQVQNAYDDAEVGN